MKKVLTLIVFVCLVMTAALAIPVSASSVSGTGQDRAVTLTDLYQDTNITVTVPAAINNGSTNSFAFVVVDTSGTSVNYTFNVSINNTWNGTVNVISVASDDITGYVNYTIYAMDIISDTNITVTMLFTDNWTQSDVWYGTVDVVSNTDYQLRVVTISLLMALMSVMIVVMLLKALINSIGQTTKKGKK